MRIELDKDEIEYLWGFLMAMVKMNKDMAIRDSELIKILAKLKRQCPSLLNMEELESG